MSNTYTIYPNGATEKSHDYYMFGLRNMFNSRRDDISFGLKMAY